MVSSEHIYTMEEFYAFGDRLHYNTVIDIIVNAFAAFIVLKYSTKAMKNYKYYILLTIIWAFLMDFHITFIFGPFNMLPSTIMCGSGFICRHLDHFWGQYLQYGILHITISCVGCSIVVGLFYQLFSLNGNFHFFHSIKGVAIIILTMIIYPFPSFSLNIPMPDFNESAEYIKEFHANTYDVFVTASSCHALKLDFKGKTHFTVLALQGTFRGILHITISCVGCSIVVGLFYQLFSLNGNFHFFHSIKGVAIIILTMIIYPFPSFSLNIPMPDFNESAEYIKEFHANTYDVFVTASSCHALKLDFKGKTHFTVLALQIVFVWIVGGIAAFKIHKKLREMKNILSPSTLKARRQLLIALCFQATIPSFLIVIPLIIMLVSVIIEADNYMNLISNIAMPIISLHSTFNALSIMYIITPYRKAVYNNVIKKIFRIKENPPQIPVENTNSNIGSPRSLSAVH